MLRSDVPGSEICPRSRSSASMGIRWSTAALLVSLFALHGCSEDGGGSFSGSAEKVKRWNRIAIDASGLDHTGTGAHEQFGPGRSSQAMAIAHIAMFEAVNAIAGVPKEPGGLVPGASHGPWFESYVGLEPPAGTASLDAAIAQSTHDALVAVFPSQASRLDPLLAEDLAAIPDSPVKSAGIDLGRAAAAGILALRVNDGSQHDEPRVGVDHEVSDAPGRWRPDPVSGNLVAMGAHWADVTPFVLESASQFRAPSPPAITSAEYAAAYDEVKRLGGDGTTTSTERTEDQTVTGIYWAYDGTPSLCAPPRLYNQIAVLIAEEHGNDALELARLLALVNVAMADAGIAIWESKYHYDYWRPVTGIRESDEGTGPTGEGDGNPATAGDPAFMPLGAPSSNLPGSNFTPPFPAYPSGHAGFGGALFQVLRRFYGTDRIAFTFVSDEFNGVTRDNEGNPRPLLPRHFDTLSQAEEENGQSRIYLGIHWSFDKTEGIAQGRHVGDYVFESLFQPR